MQNQNGEPTNMEAAKETVFQEPERDVFPSLVELTLAKVKTTKDNV